MAYYRRNLAKVHHIGYGGHADTVAPGLLERLITYREGTILELGCGSGALTKHLVAAGFDVLATDASPAMLDLAAEHVPGAEYRQLTLPDDPIPQAQAIVAVGHPLNYLDDTEAVTRAVNRCVHALAPGGALILDVCDLSYAEAHSDRTTHADVRDEWAIFVRFSTPNPAIFIREMTTFVLEEDGSWSRDDETHHNVLIDARDLATTLTKNGLDANVESAFGEETLPKGLVVFHVIKPV